MLDLAYTYDQLGNRLTKTEHEALRTTFYHYDVLEAPLDFASHNNRLQWYRVYNGVQSEEPLDVGTAIEEVMYKYDAGGKLWLAESWDWILDESDLAAVRAADAATSPWRRVPPTARRIPGASNGPIIGRSVALAGQEGEKHRKKREGWTWGGSSEDQYGRDFWRFHPASPDSPK